MAKAELPDFEDMIKITEKIFNLSRRKAELDLKIRIGENIAVKEGMDKIKIDNKRPSLSYLDATVRVTGLDNELLPLRKELAEVTNEINYLKDLLELYKLQIEVWRTLSANERASLI